MNDDLSFVLPEDQDDDLSPSPPDGGDDATEAEDSDSEPDAMELANRYEGTPPAERAAFWTDLTDEARSALRAAGIAGPVGASAEGFRPVPRHDARYQGLMHRARGELRQGLADINAGRLDVAPELYAELEDAWLAGESLPDAGEQLQRGAFLLAQAREAAFQARPFEAWSTSVYMGPDRRWYLREQDNTGRSRTRLAPTEDDDAGGEAPAEPDPASVTLDDVADWSTERLVRFKQDHPEEFERLKMAESDELDARAWGHRASGGIIG